MKTATAFFLLLCSAFLCIQKEASALKKKEHIFSFNLNNLSIPLFGFSLKGTVNFISFSPLVFSIDAEKARFDIGQFKRFLLNHNFIDQNFENKIPKIKVNGTHVKIYLDTAKRQLLFYSDLLEIENSQIKDFVFLFLEGGSFKLVFKRASIEISLLKRLIDKNLFVSFGIKELKTDGRVIILSSLVNGTLRNIKKINGSFKLKGDHIRLIAKSDNISQTFIVDRFDSEVILNNGIPTINLNQIYICSVPNGSAEIKGRIILKKKVIYIKVYKSYLNLFDKSPKSSQFNFNFDIFSKIKISSEISIDSLNINNFLRLEHILLHTRPTKKGIVFAGNGEISEMNISLTGILDPSSNLTSQIEFKGTDIDLTSFIASFSKELPVFLKGRLYINGNFLIQGNDLQSILKNSTGDIVATIDRLFVCKVSHIDPRLGFFLDIFRIAGIKPQQEDSLLFKKCVVKGVLKNGNLLLKKFIFIGSPISVLANGTFFINKRRLKITGLVKTEIGIKKHLKIDRYLKKEI